MSLETPLEDDPLYTTIDWLELTAFLSTERSAHLDLIGDAFGIAQDKEAADFGESDARLEDLYVSFSNEITTRQGVLGLDAYPFSMSANGEAVEMRAPTHFGHYSYLISLVIHHSWASGKLRCPTRLSKTETTMARSVFEVVCAIAALGFASGPSFLLGTNRSGADQLLERIKHICVVAGEGQAREALHRSAPEAANDDGVDIIAITPEADGPPARDFYFGQAASGKNFPSKPIKNVIDGFLEIWFSMRPANTKPLMFIPAILEETDSVYYTTRLGHMIHRMRLPKYAAAGADLLDSDGTLLHFVEDPASPLSWFRDYAERVGAPI